MLMNLSLQGCRIKGPSPFSCETRLRLRLELPDQAQPVKVEQTVIRWAKRRSIWSKLSGGAPDARARVEQVFQLLHEAQ